MNAPCPEICERLRQLSDDCYQWAIDATQPEAISQYCQAAREARLQACARHASQDAQRIALRALQAQRELAAWYDGDPDAFALGERPGDANQATAKPLQLVPNTATELFNARQLAVQFGLSESGARNIIKRGCRRRLAGFTRDGASWLADPNAFSRARQKCGIGEGSI